MNEPREATPEEHARLREIWRSCRKRTMNARCKDFGKYGASHIRMCKEWEKDFEEFKKWAMAHGYRQELTLDRIDNNRGYEPYNCRWVSRRVQANNRSTNIRITCRGETHTIAQWGRLSGTPAKIISRRLSRGWSPERAVFEPVREYRK